MTSNRYLCILAASLVLTLGTACGNDGGGDSAADGTNGTNGDGAATTTGDAPTGGPAVCTSTPMGECHACMQTNCCAELEVCMANASSQCSCIADCVFEGGEPEDCSSTCGADSNTAQDFNGCMASSCSGCPGGTDNGTGTGTGTGTATGSGSETGTGDTGTGTGTGTATGTGTGTGSASSS